MSIDAQSSTSSSQADVSDCRLSDTGNEICSFNADGLVLGSSIRLRVKEDGRYIQCKIQKSGKTDVNAWYVSSWTRC
jgi:hypothetical protein